MGYIALRPLEMRDGSTRAAGQPVPEAKQWDNPMAWIRSGDVALVNDDKEDEFVAALARGVVLQDLAVTSALGHLHAAAYNVSGRQGPAAVRTASDALPDAPSDAHPDAVVASEPAPSQDRGPAGGGAAPAADGAVAADDASADGDDTEEVVDDTPADPSVPVDPTAPPKPRIRRVRKAKR